MPPAHCFHYFGYLEQLLKSSVVTAGETSRSADCCLTTETRAVRVADVRM